MSTPASAPPGELVAVATIHAGDTVLLPDHGTLVAVLVITITRGTTGDGPGRQGRNVCFCGWQASADPSVHGTAGLGSEDMITRVSTGIAA